jgi:uncharacterized protein (TIGR02118 family)
MATVSVIYPRQDGATFDFDYYENTHLPLVARLWADAGLTGGEALRGIAGPDGKDAPFLAIGLIQFESIDRFQAAMQGEHAAEVLGDIANFTNVQPILQVNERIIPAL